LHTFLSRNDLRKVKKGCLREARVTERFERQQRVDRDRKAKQKQYDYLQNVVQHGRDMFSRRKNLASKQLKLGRAVVHWHSTIEKEEARRQERMSKERLKALKVLKPFKFVRYTILNISRPMMRKLI